MKNKIVACCVFIAACLVPALRSFGEDRPPSIVPLVSLIAMPEKYNNQTIRVIGYLGKDYTVVYLCREHAENLMLNSRIWITYSKEDATKIVEYVDSYVLIDGIFTIEGPQEHSKFARGTISVKRMGKWPPR